MRRNFSKGQRQSAFEANALWLRDHRVDGVELAVACDQLRCAGLVYYCENCLFCHTNQGFFDVDHLVPDRAFAIWGKHEQARLAINMNILCKSSQAGDRGCNQCKGASQSVPRGCGLAFTKPQIDMNIIPLRDRPFSQVG